ncbi:MAG: hypothetical protein WD894_21995 [Pirellulales bacterium]
MASPFTVFRRNQKVLLAVTGILAMIAFVFLGTCVQSPGPVQAYENPTVVSWKYGDITEGEMADRIVMRRILNHFLRSARVAAGFPVNQNETVFLETEDSVVRSMVLARRGRELGLVIGDDLVNRVLAQLTNNRVPPAELERIIGNVGIEGRQRITAKQIFDALREELLARHVAMLFLDGLGAEGQDAVPPLDTPAQRWDHFRRLERKATVQVLPVPVAEFTEEVGKPSDEQLQKLFNDYKDRFPAPNSPEPGFRQPYRARFEFFKSDNEELVTAEMKNVTEDEVREYYEKNKDAKFRKSKLTPIDEGAEKEDAKDDAAPEDATKDAKKDGVKEDNAKGKESAAQGSDVEKTSDAKSADKVKDEPTKEDQDSKPTDDAAPADAKSLPKSDQDAKGAEKSAHLSRHSPFRLANFQDEKGQSGDAPKQPDNDEPKSEAKREPAPDAARDKASAEPKTGDTKKDVAKDDSAPDTARDTKEAPKDETAPDAADATKDAKSDGAKTDAPEPEPVEYRPLEQVEEEIRRTLARERVQKLVEERFTELRAEVNRYAKLRMRWEREVAKNPEEPKPKPLDLQALADKYELKLFTTELISRIDTANNPDLDIARSYDFSAGSPGRPFAEWSAVAFEKGNLYRPRTSDSLEGNRFLWWKIEEKQGQVPKFSDARQEVLEAWKRIQARDVAKRQAEQYAKTVRQAKQPMKEVFAQDKDLPVTEVGPFSWLTRPNVPMDMMQQLPQVHYPEIAGVLNPSAEFMEATFDLAPDEVGVAFNHPKSIVYVIQPVSFTPSDTVLEQEFMVRIRDYDRYRAAGGVAFAEAQENWMESLFAEYGVRWHRTADIQNAAFE